MNAVARTFGTVFGRNPLARPADRLQAALLTVVVALGMLLVPVMLTIGTVTYANLMAKGEWQTRNWRQTAAVITEDTQGAGTSYQSEPAGATTWVAAKWQAADGTTRTGRVPVDHGIRTGEKVTVWLNDRGEPSAAPIDGPSAAAGGAFVAVTGYFVTTGVLVLLYYGSVRLIERRKLRAWQDEWTRVEPKWRNQLR